MYWECIFNNTNLCKITFRLKGNGIKRQTNKAEGVLTSTLLVRILETFIEKL